MTDTDKPVLALMPVSAAQTITSRAPETVARKQALCHHDFEDVEWEADGGEGSGNACVCVDCGFPCTVQERVDYERRCAAVEVTP